MALFNAAFPVLPGKEDAARAFSKEVMGPRLDDFLATQKACETTEELWTLQQTPAGSFMLVYFEGDVEKAFTHLATDNGEFVTWFRGQVQEICGVDLTQPDDGPPPETLLEWKA